MIPVGSSNIGIKDVLERAIGGNRALSNAAGTVHWIGPFLKDSMPVLIWIQRLMITDGDL